MEYVYAAMLLHSAEKEIDDKTVTAVLTAAGVDAVRQSDGRHWAVLTPSVSRPHQSEV